MRVRGIACLAIAAPALATAPSTAAAAPRCAIVGLAIARIARSHVLAAGAATVV